MARLRIPPGLQPVHHQRGQGFNGAYRLIGRFPAEMAEWAPGVSGARDDALDALAGCLLAEPVRLARAGPAPRAAYWRGN